MEDQIPVGANGSVGEVDLKVVAGVADASFNGDHLLFGFLKLKYSVGAELDVVGALGAIKAYVEDKTTSPLLKPIEEFTFNELISLAQGLK